MADKFTEQSAASAPGVALPPYPVPRINVIALGMSLGTFLVVTYILCIVFDLWFPNYAMNSVWSPLLPGFTWLTWPGFFLGLAEAFSYGWYIALVFAPIHNFCVGRFR